MAKRGRKPSNWARVQSVGHDGVPHLRIYKFENRVELYRYLLKLGKELFDEEERIKNEKDTSSNAVDPEC